MGLKWNFRNLAPRFSCAPWLPVSACGIDPRNVFSSIGFKKLWKHFFEIFRIFREILVEKSEIFENSQILIDFVNFRKFLIFRPEFLEIFEKKSVSTIFLIILN